MNGNVASSDYTKWPTYYGISASHTTTLTANLGITDSNISVANVFALTPPSLITSTPGKVFINGEKIYFWGINYTNGTLTNIRRAVDGTGAPTSHAVGSKVVDTNSGQLIPGNTVVNGTAWLNQAPTVQLQLLFTDSSHNSYNFVSLGGNIMTTIQPETGIATDGSGLQGSITPQANFLKTLI